MWVVGGRELQQAVVSWCTLLIARSCMHGILRSIIYRMCVLGLAEQLEARVLKLSLQTKAPGNTPRAKARPTPDGCRGLRRQRGRGVGRGANRFRRKGRGVLVNESKVIFKKSSQA